MKFALPLLFILSAASSFNALAHDPNKPHTNQGLIKPYGDKVPEVTLTEDELKTLNKGEPVYTTVPYEGGGRSTAVFKVKASSSKIWSLIRDFNNYPKMIGGRLKSTKIYKEEGDKVWVEFTIGLPWPLGDYTYYVEHNYPMGKTGWATWKLDYSRLSDFDDNVGFWRVKDVGNGESIVTYSVELRISDSVPGWIKNMIVKSGLTEATQWVKRVAEGH